MKKTPFVRTFVWIKLYELSPAETRLTVYRRRRVVSKGQIGVPMWKIDMIKMRFCISFNVFILSFSMFKFGVTSKNVFRASRESISFNAFLLSFGIFNLGVNSKKFFFALRAKA